MSKCEYCGQTFPSDSSVSSHLWRKHKDELPWWDVEKLTKLYWDEGMTQSEIASELGCSLRAIESAFNRYDIETRKTSRVEYANYHTNTDGYSIWHDATTQNTVGVHQLLAIADGADPYKVFSGGEWHCHHENRNTWDNRRENIELLDAKEHSRIHAKELHKLNKLTPEAPSKETLKRLRWDEGLNQRQIAERLDLTHATVNEHIRNYELAWDQKGPNA